MKFYSDLTEIRLICSELTVAEYKQILKCSFGDEPNLHVFSETICTVLGNLTNKPLSFFKNLPITDVLLVLIDLRLKSMGDVVTVSLNNDKIKRSIDLNLTLLKEDVQQFYAQFSNTKIKQADVDIFMSIPSIEMLSTKTSEEYLYFIKSVKLKNKDPFEITNVEMASSLFETIPAKTASKIINYCQEFIKDIQSLNLLSRYKGIDQTFGFIPTIENLLWFVKLMFNEPLSSFYDNIFYLAKHVNMSPSYIESCTPGEYIYFTKKLEEFIAAQNQGNQQQPDYDHSSDEFPEDLRDGSMSNDGYVDL